MYFDADYCLQGDQGSPGLRGMDGEPGQTGDRGERGIKGDRGVPGINGSMGSPVSASPIVYICPHSHLFPLFPAIKKCF